MATKVLDSWALIAFFEDEPAAERVERLLVKAEAGTHNLLLCVVNWGEIYYNTMRTVSQQAAIYKATRRLSYADAFAAALAKIRNAELVTGDHEFRQIEDEIKIDWLK